MNNPFQQIDKSIFPATKRAGKAQKIVPASNVLDDISEEESTDQSLFLRAMSNVSRQGDQKKHVHKSGEFTLGEKLIIPKNDSIKGTNVARAIIKSPTPKIDGTPASATANDEDEFLGAMQEVVPLAGNGRSIHPVPDRKIAAEVAQDLMASFMEGKLEFALSNTNEYCEGYVVGLDEMTMNKLRAGALSPEAHLDLHGLNAVQAFEAMRNFMRGSWYKSLRTILIIPGRGQNSPNGIGILRTKVQDWLTQEPFKRIVLAFCTAQQLDGGLGSLYVLLRKYKKKGRVYWERTPNDVDLNELA